MSFASIARYRFVSSDLLAQLFDLLNCPFYILQFIISKILGPAFSSAPLFSLFPFDGWFRVDVVRAGFEIVAQLPACHLHSFGHVSNIALVAVAVLFLPAISISTRVDGNQEHYVIQPRRELSMSTLNDLR